MKLQIEERHREDIAILDLKGPLIKGEQDFSVLQRLLLLLDSRRPNVIVNLREVSRIDASGLATLAFCATRFHDAGGRVVFIKPSRADHHKTDLLEPDAALEIYLEELDAVNSFFPDRVVSRYDILEFVQKRKARTA